MTHTKALDGRLTFEFDVEADHQTPVDGRGRGQKSFQEMENFKKMENNLGEWL